MYKPPKTRVYHVFNPTLSSEEAAHIPVVIGTVKQLVRYDRSESSLSYIGPFTGAASYAYPSLGAGCVTEQTTFTLVAAEAMAGIQRGAYLEDILVACPYNEAINDALDTYFTALVSNQRNLFVFTPGTADGQLNLAGSSMIRSPKVGDSIKVRQTSQDTTGQFSDWTSVIKELVYKKAARVAGGVGSAEEGLSNTQITEPSEALGSSIIAGDGMTDHIGVVVHSVFDPAFDKVADIDAIRSTARNKLADAGLMTATELRPVVRVLDVDIAGNTTIEFSSALLTRQYLISNVDLVLNKTSDQEDKFWFGAPVVNGVFTEEPGVWYATTPGAWEAYPGTLGVSGETECSFGEIGGVLLDSVFLVQGYADGGDNTFQKNDELSIVGTLKYREGPLVLSTGAATQNLPAYITITDGPIVGVDGRYYLYSCLANGEQAVWRNENERPDPNDTFSFRIKPDGTSAIGDENEDKYEAPGTTSFPSKDGFVATSGGSVPTVDFSVDGSVPYTYIPYFSVQEKNAPYGWAGGFHLVESDGTSFKYQRDADAGIEFDFDSTTGWTGLDSASIEFSHPSMSPLIPLTDWVSEGTKAATQVIEYSMLTVAGESAIPATEGIFDSNTSRTYAVEIVTGGEVGNPDANITARVYAVDRSVPDRFVQLVLTETLLNGSSKPYYTGTIALGAEGATIELSIPGEHKPVIIAGDEWFVECTSISGDQLVGVITGDSFPYFGGSTTVEQRMDIEFLQPMSDIEIPALQYDSSVNWDLDENGVNIHAEIQIWDEALQSEMTLSTGSTVLHGDYKAIDTANVGTPFFYTGADERIRDNDPDNPVGYGVNTAAVTSVAPIYVIPLGLDPETDLVKALTKLEQKDPIYAFSIMTYDMTLQNLVDAHVKKLCTPDYSLWRRCFLAKELRDELGVIGTDEVVNATFTTNTVDGDGNPATSRLEVVDVDLSAARTGDEVRYNYVTDYRGETSYDTALVDRVLASDEILLQSGVPPTAVGSKIEIWTATRPEDVVLHVGNRALSLNYTHTQLISPSSDVIDAAGELVPSYFITASLAGLATASHPHESLTDKYLTSWYDVDVTPQGQMSAFELNELADTGVMILIGNTGAVKIRHDLTTDMSSIEVREGMVARNVCDLSYRYRAVVDAFRSVSNISDDLLGKVRQHVNSETSSIKTTTDQGLLGAQLRSADIVTLTVPDGAADTILLELDTNVPVVLNNVDLKLIISGAFRS